MSMSARRSETCRPVESDRSQEVPGKKHVILDMKHIETSMITSIHNFNFQEEVQTVSHSHPLQRLHQNQLGGSLIQRPLAVTTKPRRCRGIRKLD